MSLAPSPKSQYFLSSHTVKTPPSKAASAKENLSGNSLRQPVFLVSAIILLVVLFATYSNHFNNPFHFDDSHTIVNNMAIRDFSNLPRFLTDATTFSTLPANQAWRPGVTTLNAIDTALSGGVPDQFVFHVSIFSSYVVLGFLLFFFLLHIFRKAFKEINYSHWAALIATGFFMLHTANAETINYIIARADSFSTMMVLFAFNLYFYSKKSRKYYLFLIPVFFGFLVKEPTIMFGPILLIYIWLFGDPDQNKSRARGHVILSFALALVLYYWSTTMAPPHWNTGGGPWYQYLATQAFVVVHYFYNFVLPVNLSADTDWVLITNYFDDRIFIGVLFVAGLLLLTWTSSKKDQSKPISFGIMWFFIALIPTSSIFSLSEVLNDHRTFFPYIGLVIAGVTAGVMLFEKFKAQEKTSIAKPALITFSVLLMLTHAYGTYQRNKVWNSGRSLWKDVTEKSPGNGRGWMNYGLALMDDKENPDMPGAIEALTKALSLYPNYSYANINMALAQSRVGNDKGAEAYYLKAIQFDQYNPACYYFYGMYLMKVDRISEAEKNFRLGYDLSPTHEGINQMLSKFQGGTFKSKIDIARNQLAQNPSAENYVNLSLELYNIGEYENSANAANEALKLKPDYAIAYNNICAAYNKIGEFEKAEEAGKRAVEIEPKNDLFIGNYSAAQSDRKKFTKMEADTKSNPSYEAWVNLSLAWYNAGNFKKSMIAAEAATLMNPNDAIGWNNVCAAANKIGDWDRAIIAGEKAIKIKPDFEQARNNLALAKEGKKKSEK